MEKVDLEGLPGYRSGYLAGYEKGLKDAWKDAIEIFKDSLIPRRTKNEQNT